MLGFTRRRRAAGLIAEPDATIGYVDERSAMHVAGWLRDPADPGARLRYEVMLDGAVIASGVADEPSAILVKVGVGDGRYAFTVLFDRPLPAGAAERVWARREGGTGALPLAPALRTAFEPLDHVALDIVNNCNLRCPFCVYDYANTRATKLMSEATYDAALRLLPFTRDGEFWLSCLHEATLHPRLADWIERVPAEWRRKLMFTTNLARRMPESYFATLARSGMHHLNVSLESLDPPSYERFRDGARFPIFAENWDRLLAAFASGPAPPALRYNLIAFRSNLRELPTLARTLVEEKRGALVEIRHTYDEAHIPAAFKAAEYPAPEDWAWLAEELHPLGEHVRLIPPPVAPPPSRWADQPDVEPATRALAEAASDASEAAGRPGVPKPVGVRIQWDGALFVYQGGGEHRHYMVSNINHIRDAFRFVTAL